MHNRLGIDANSTNGDLYRIDGTGQLFQYVGWKRLESDTRTISITAANFLYRIDTQGFIYKYLPDNSTWLRIDENCQVKSITSAGPYVYKLHRDGSIFRLDGSSTSPSWTLINHNPQTIMISAEGNDIYAMHINGDIVKFGGFHGKEDRIDNDTDNKLIVSGRSNIYKMRYDGSIWRHQPQEGSWEQLSGDQENTVQITAGEAGLFQLCLNPQKLYIHVQGQEWDEISGYRNNGPGRGVIMDISSGNNGLYLSKRNGEIWRYDITDKQWFNLQ